MTLDMTKGKPSNHLWRYALPLLLGNWLQLLYNAVDSIIAGRFIGKEALAAEGIAGPVMNLLILFITGLCIGSSVLMSEAFGRGDYRRLKECQSTLLLFGFISSLIISSLLVVLSREILFAISCPEDIFDITNIYLRIIFAGTPFTFMYNALSSGLKSVGNSKTPLIFLAFSSVLNALLDLIFLGIFRFGIICSALTTVIAEAFSCILAFLYIYKKEDELRIDKASFGIKKDILKKILSYGGPTALQQAVQPIGKVLIQGSVNSLGVDSIAAFNAVTRVDDAACIPEQGIASSIATFIAQNRGTEKNERIREGFRNGIILEVGYFVFIAAFTYILKRDIVSLFVSGEDFLVISYGEEYLSVMAFFYIFPALTNGFQGFYRGMGKMYTTLIGTLIQTVIRTTATFFLAPKYGILGISYACAIGWGFMLLFEIPYYFITTKKRGLR